MTFQTTDIAISGQVILNNATYSFKIQEMEVIIERGLRLLFILRQTCPDQKDPTNLKLMVIEFLIQYLEVGHLQDGLKG